MALRYTPVVYDHLLLVTRLCEQFFSTKNTFLTVSVITKLAKIKKQEYLIRAHCVRHVNYAMQRMSRDRLLQSTTADSLLAPILLGYSLLFGLYAVALSLDIVLTYPAASHVYLQSKFFSLSRRRAFEPQSSYPVVFLEKSFRQQFSW